jgi:hypothetical protein
MANPPSFRRIGKQLAPCPPQRAVRSERRTEVGQQAAIVGILGIP